MSGQEIMVQVTQQTVYLMGISFILGSLCTVFILLILDMVRLARAQALETQMDTEEANEEGEEKDRHAA